MYTTKAVVKITPAKNSCTNCYSRLDRSFMPLNLTTLPFMGYNTGHLGA